MTYKILLLSAYDAMSHKMWRNRLVKMFPEHEWTQLTLPPRHFNWRIRGNSLQWALNERDLLNQDYNLLIVTSMVDLASLRGFLPKLAQLPTLLYFHENQFVYPLGSQQRNSNIEPKLVPMYSALCADSIVFNSAYNRNTFLQGARALLEKLPDRLSPDLLARIENGQIVPVPLEGFAEQPAAPKQKQLLELVWNHRWEYDKGPKLLLQIVETVLQQQLPIRMHIVGQKFRSVPAEFQQIEAMLAQHAASLAIEPGSFGFIENRADYIDLLRRCDIVLSTAGHDFQGLSIQEACALGCTPVVPDALVYPEYIEGEFLYEMNDEDCTDVLRQLKRLIRMHQENRELPKVSLDGFSQQALRPKYAELIENLVARDKS
jgi:glycosyltransferase involved in cell wall biosynthesis